MLAVNPNIVKHIKETAIMGFVEVLKNLRKISSFIRTAKSDIKDFDPDLILFIDYPGFNLRIAKWAKSKDYKTAYYIAPKVWAWKESRVHKLKKYIDKLYVIFPFEVDYFRQFDINATFLGNPLAFDIQRYKSSNPTTKQATALLPGSRKQELKRHLDLLYDYAASRPENTFYLPLAQGFSEQDLAHISKRNPPENVAFSKDSWEVLNACDFGIIASGTASWEAMLFGVNQIVIYKAHWLSYLIAKQLVKTKFISLVNINAQKTVIPELIQEDANLQELDRLTTQLKAEKSTVLNQYTTINTGLKVEENPFELFAQNLLTSFSSSS